MYRTWKYKSFLAMGAIWVALTGVGCPDEPVIEGAPGAGQEVVPPPPPPSSGDQGVPSDEGAPPVAGDEGAAVAASGEAVGDSGGAAVEGDAAASADAGSGDEAQPAAVEPKDVPPQGPEGAGQPGNIPFTPLPPNLLSQAEIKKGDAVKIKGTLTGDMCQNKRIRIEALSLEDSRPTMLTALIKKGIGPFELFLPKSDSEVWISAACDTNDNNLIDVKGDHVAAYKANPVKPSQDVTGVLLKLEKPGDGPVEGMPPMNKMKPAE